MPLFAKFTERTKGSAGGKGSNNLFVLTWLHGANKLLRPGRTYEADLKYCVEWWIAVVASIPVLAEYDPRDPRRTPAEIRDYLCCTALTLKALAIVGKNYSRRFIDSPETLTEFLKPLAQIDWRKDNPEWEGLVIETTPIKNGVKQKILSRNVDVLSEVLRAKLKSNG